MNTLPLLLAGLFAASACSDRDPGRLADQGTATADQGQATDARISLDSGVVDGHNPGDDAEPKANSLEDCLADLAPSKQTPNHFVGVLYLESDDGSRAVAIAREPGDRHAVGETFAYDLVRFGRAEGSTVTCVDDTGMLDYDFEHHNWNDTARATIGPKAYSVHLSYQFATPAQPNPKWDISLTVTDAAAGSVLEGPIPLGVTNCRSIPPNNYNACALLK